MTKIKSKRNILIGLVMILLLASFILVGCGDNTITDITSLRGIVEQVKISTSGENINSITIVYLSKPSKIEANYNDAKLETTEVLIEDYYNDSTNVTAYSYTFEIENITTEEYNLSPITIKCSVNNNNYKFNLSTDLIENIYSDIENTVQ